MPVTGQRQRKPAAGKLVVGGRGLHLVPAGASHDRRRPNPVELWHLLSLDAASVAALWTWFIGRSTGVQLPRVSTAAMLVAVWMVYVADRLLDARAGRAAELEERHYFHRRHARAFLRGFAAAAVVLALLLEHLAPTALRLYALLAALLAVWLLLIHARPQPSPRRLPKELVVGIFFPAAVFIPTVARAPQLQLQLLPSAVLFAAACTLNCLFVYAWEHPDSRSAAHATTRWGVRHARMLACCTAAAGLAAVCATAVRPVTALRPLAGASAASALLLLLLERTRHRLGRTTVRALADAALLTPLAFVVAHLVQRWLA